MTNGTHLRTFRLAVACTIEYAQTSGGTVASTMSAIATTIHRVNSIYEVDLASRFELVDENRRIVFVDQDEFDNNNANALINQSQRVIDREIGDANYDIGHTFSTGAGGLAGLAVLGVSGQKARGVTGSDNPHGDAYDIDYVAHELGHQFGANHTFNSVAGACGGGNRNASTAVEPGSGTTIMAYAGICAADDVQPHSDGYFHAVSLDEMFGTLGGVTPHSLVPTGNRIPDVRLAAPYFAIPARTPFALTTRATDPDADALSYCWEQIDVGPSAARGSPDDGSIPLFRSFSPLSAPTRCCPSISALLSGSGRDEQLPTRDRLLNFRVTVRDHNRSGGGVNGAEMQLKVLADRGPFQVTAPAAGARLSQDVTVKWGVAGTDAAPINCRFVNILLSTDGGRTFPQALARSTPNDGSEKIVVRPPSASDQLRIKIEAADNVFFAVSPEFFVDGNGGANDTPFTPNRAGDSVRFGTPKLPNATTSTPLDDTRIRSPELPSPSLRPQGRPHLATPQEPASVERTKSAGGMPNDKSGAPAAGATTRSSTPIRYLHFGADGALVDQRELAALVAAVREEGPSDVILLAHGWNNSPEDARTRYEQLWNQTMAAISSTDFRPLVIGVIWPSKAWIDENQIGVGAARSTDGLEDSQLRRLAVLDALDPRLDPEHYLGDVEALNMLLTRSSLSKEEMTVGIALLGKYSKTRGTNPEPVEEAGIFLGEPANIAGGLSGTSFKDIFRTFTFWQMKQRAGLVGESGLAPALARLLTASQPSTRWHLVGHSFGAKLVLATTAGAAAPPRAVDSLTLLQGALSAYACAGQVPGHQTSGSYRLALDPSRVRGPIVATFTDEDYPLTWAFPLGTRLNHDTGELRGAAASPRYEALGAVGFQGLASGDRHQAVAQMNAVGNGYSFRPGVTYSVRASGIHSHSDLDHPEVGWLISCALAAPREVAARSPAETSGLSPVGANAPDGPRIEGRRERLDRGTMILPRDFLRRPLQTDRMREGGVAADVGRADADQDGLTDAEEATLGCDPRNPDTDGDALLDGWEVHPVNGVDLHALGASPLHKDIFVEMDYMQRASASLGLGPNATVIAGIEAAFAAAPVSNPDGVDGIRIHLEQGNEVQYKDDLIDVYGDFGLLKSNHFSSKKAPFFHYMIWANAYNGGTSSGISMGIPSSDFIVSLGRWNNGAGGTNLQKIGTFVHELGHNLGLKHGGSEHVNFKPNHLSVMNYSFQTQGISVNGSRIYSYQRQNLAALDESALEERIGLQGGASTAGFRTIYVRNGVSLEVDAAGPIDWDADGGINSRPLALDLNGDTQRTILASTFNEWGALTFHGGSIGSLADISALLPAAERAWRVLPFEELTEEVDRTLAR